MKTEGPGSQFREGSLARSSEFALGHHHRWEAGWFSVWLCCSVFDSMSDPIVSFAPTDSLGPPLPLDPVKLVRLNKGLVLVHREFALSSLSTLSSENGSLNPNGIARTHPASFFDLMRRK